MYVLLVMGVPSIEAAASSLLTRVPIASLPGRLPLRIIDRIRHPKSRKWAETSGNEATEVVH